MFEAVVGVARLHSPANQRAALASGVCVFQAAAALPLCFKGAERLSRLPANGRAGGGAPTLEKLAVQLACWLLSGSPWRCASYSAR